MKVKSKILLSLLSICDLFQKGCSKAAIRDLDCRKPRALSDDRSSEMLIRFVSLRTECNTHLRKSAWMLFQTSIHSGGDTYFPAEKWAGLIPECWVLAFSRTTFGSHTGPRWLARPQWPRRQRYNRCSGSFPSATSELAWQINQKGWPGFPAGMKENRSENK